ncbi:hypothetical protein [Candidatus Accumulibacter sp. ACC007]|nr:hypothetical protein [Candidatus Accumulibacter sp. ACC007]
MQHISDAPTHERIIVVILAALLVPPFMPEQMFADENGQDQNEKPVLR